MSVIFEKLSPRELSSSAVVPQALDNQWVTTDLLNQMIKTQKGFIDVKNKRIEMIKKEWRRALIYNAQVVVNRAYMFSNPVIMDDYINKEARKGFKNLLGNRAIVLYLHTEDAPDERPLYEISNEIWNSWLDTIFDEHLSCVRLDWGIKKDADLLKLNSELENFSRTFHDYIQKLGSPTLAEHLATNFSIRKEEFPRFRDILNSVCQFSYSTLVRRDRYVNRNDLYSEFISTENTSPSEGYYRSEPFTAILKQIFDLKYNVNLPDALGCYLLIPAGSPPRSALGDLDDAINRKLVKETDISDIFYSLRHLTFDKVSSGLSLKDLDKLSLNDIVSLRDTHEWHEYIQTLNNLNQRPMEFPELSTRFFEKYRALNKKLSEIKMGIIESQWEPYLKFVISVGAKTMELVIDPKDPTQKAFNTIVDGYIPKGATSFLVKMAVASSQKADENISLEIMKGTIQNGQETWRELIGQLGKDVPGLRDQLK